MSDDTTSPEGGREGGPWREGGRERGQDAVSDDATSPDGGREGGREGERRRMREGGRERGREGCCVR